MSQIYDLKDYDIVAPLGGTRQVIVGSTTQSLAELLPPVGATPPITQALVDSCSICQIRVSVNSIKLMYDGGDPSGVDGFPLAQGETFTVEGNKNVNNIKVIRNTGSDANVFIVLERVT